MSQTIPTNAYSGNPVPLGGGTTTPQAPSMPQVFRLIAKDGTEVPVQADSVEDAFSILDQMEAEGLVPKSAANRFVHGVADSLNPVSLVKGVAGMIAHPIDNVVGPMVRNRVMADEMDKQGRTSEAMGYRAGGILPIVGPMAVGIGEQAGSGDIAGAAGRLTGLAVAPRVVGNVVKGARVAGPAIVEGAQAIAANPTVRSVAKSAAIGATAYGAHALWAANPGLALFFASALAGKVMTRGGLVKAGIEYLTKEGVKPADAVKQAQTVAQSYEDLVSSVKAKPAEAAEIFEANKIPDFLQVKILKDASETIKPIPPSKMPVRAPNPTVDDIEAAPVAPKVNKARAEELAASYRKKAGTSEAKQAAKAQSVKKKAPKPETAPMPVRGEAFETRVRHATTKENAESIRKTGFDPDRKGHGLGGDDYGPGVYLADESSDAGSFWRYQLETKNESGTVPVEMLSGNVKFQNALRVEDIGRAIPGPGGRHTGMYAPLGARGIVAKYLPDHLPAFDKAIAGGTTPNRALGSIAREAGYDGMVLDRMRGQEIIAFSPKNVQFEGVPTVRSPASSVVEAKPAFKGQQGAVGATKARFAGVAERTVKGWIQSGKSDAFIKDKLENMFKMPADEAESLIRAVGGKGK